ncbi:hypothetical protein [Blastococcus sp. SYSU D00695]
MAQRPADEPLDASRDRVRAWPAEHGEPAVDGDVPVRALRVESGRS